MFRFCPPFCSILQNKKKLTFPGSCTRAEIRVVISHATKKIKQAAWKTSIWSSSDKLLHSFLLLSLYLPLSLPIVWLVLVLLCMVGLVLLVSVLCFCSSSVSAHAVSRAVKAAYQVHQRPNEAKKHHSGRELLLLVRNGSHAFLPLILQCGLPMSAKLNAAIS